MDTALTVEDFNRLLQANLDEKRKLKSELIKNLNNIKRTDEQIIAFDLILKELTMQELTTILVERFVAISISDNPNTP